MALSNFLQRKALDGELIGVRDILNQHGFKAEIAKEQIKGKSFIKYTPAESLMVWSVSKYWFPNFSAVQEGLGLFTLYFRVWDLDNSFGEPFMTIGSNTKQMFIEEIVDKILAIDHDRVYSRFARKYSPIQLKEIVQTLRERGYEAEVAVKKHYPSVIFSKHDSQIVYLATQRKYNRYRLFAGSEMDPYKTNLCTIIAEEGDTGAEFVDAFLGQIDQK